MTPMRPMPALRFSSKSSPSVYYLEADRFWAAGQGIARVWNSPQSYGRSWDYDLATIAEPELASIGVDHTAKNVEVGHAYSTTSQNGFYLAGKLQGGIKDIFSGGMEGELSFSWNYADTKSDKMYVEAALPNGEVTRFDLNVWWHNYAGTKAIDNFWCPPDVRTDNGFYNRPWFITYTTANVTK